jgi:CTP:phosphocholine cytidylyltransferase-like protein
MCLLKEFGMENKKMLRKNSFTQEERNSQYFSVKRSEFYEQPDSTPDLDDVFTI